MANDAVKMEVEGAAMEKVEAAAKSKSKSKPPFRLVEDDSKPLLKDPIRRSDPVETEQAVLRLPPFPTPMKQQSSLRR